MRVEIGEKIRELRRQYGRTQENPATALGVACQAHCSGLKPAGNGK